MYLSNVRVAQIAWLTFQIPYAAVFTSAHGAEHVRSGVLIRVTTAEGLVGLGEASPLPAFGGGRLADTLACIAAGAPRLAGCTLAEAFAYLDRLDYTAPGVAAAACGFDTALLDVCAQRAGVPLARLLSAEVAPAVPVNAVIGAAGLAAACQAAGRAVQAGIQCVKLKVGVSDAHAAELDRIAAVRAAIGPGTRLRLDANGAWPVPAAIARLRAAQRYDLELVEQPVAADDLAGMAQVRAAVQPLIAADESVGGPQQAARVLAAHAADVLVIKPMLAGGLRRARTIIGMAGAAGLRTLITTTIDTGVGVAAALHLAAMLPAPQLACGLATGPLLAGDVLAQPITVHNGMIWLPDQPGLGVRLAEHQLARYAGAWRY